MSRGNRRGTMAWKLAAATLGAATLATATLAAALLAGCPAQSPGAGPGMPGVAPGTAPGGAAPGLPGGGTAKGLGQSQTAPAVGSILGADFWGQMRPLYRKGARWSYVTTTKITNLPTGDKTSETRATQEIVDVTAKEATVRTTTVVDGETSSHEYKVPLDKLGGPPGADQAASSPEAPNKATVTFKYLGSETVQVPAGTFQASKIESETSETSATPVKGILWYNPEVGLVKIETTIPAKTAEDIGISSTTELEEFKKGS